MSGPGMRPLRDSRPIIDDAEAMHERLAEEGYLYVPGLLDPSRTEAVLADLRASLHGVGWLRRPDSLEMADGDIASFTAAYPVVQSLESFHKLAFLPRLWSLMERLLDGEIFCHPARVIRLVPPAPGRYATRAHQDFVVQHVTSDALTAWIPLTPCDARRQGLRLIPGSHHDGFLPTDPSQGGRRPLYLPVAPDDERWATADYALGDVVVFHNLMVHAGGPNASTKIRLSADVRYQLTTDPLRAEFARPHGWPVTPDWDELAASWQSREWIRLDPAVQLVELPADVDYGTYLARLQAPPSRLLARRARARAASALPNGSPGGTPCP